MSTVTRYSQMDRSPIVKLMMIRYLLAFMIFCLCINTSSAKFMDQLDTLKCSIKSKMENSIRYGELVRVELKKRFERYRADVIPFFGAQAAEKLAAISNEIVDKHKQGHAADACFKSAEMEFTRVINSLNTSKCDESDLPAINKGLEADIKSSNRIGQRIINKINADINRCYTSSKPVRFARCMQRHFPARINSTEKFDNSITDLHNFFESIRPDDAAYFPCFAALRNEVYTSIQNISSRALDCIRFIY